MILLYLISGSWLFYHILPVGLLIWSGLWCNLRAHNNNIMVQGTIVEVTVGLTNGIKSWNTHFVLLSEKKTWERKWWERESGVCVWWERERERERANFIDPSTHNTTHHTTTNNAAWQAPIITLNWPFFISHSAIPTLPYIFTPFFLPLTTHYHHLSLFSSLYIYLSIYLHTITILESAILDCNIKDRRIKPVHRVPDSESNCKQLFTCTFDFQFVNCVRCHIYTTNSQFKVNWV